MKTLDDTIESLERRPHEYENFLIRSEMTIESALKYLKEYRDIRNILPDKVISYCGRNPVVQIGSKYFAVREYLPTERSWRCHQVEISPITQTWVCCEDENFIIDNTGKILYREIGWDLRREKWEGE